MKLAELVMLVLVWGVLLEVLVWVWVCGSRLLASCDPSELLPPPAGPSVIRA